MGVLIGCIVRMGVRIMVRVKLLFPRRPFIPVT